MAFPAATALGAVSRLDAHARLRVVARFEQGTLTADTISVAATMLEGKGVCCLRGLLGVVDVVNTSNQRLLEDLARKT